MSVLQGAQRLLDECEAVLSELNPDALARAGSSDAQVIQTLKEYGFEPHTPTAEGQLHARTEEIVSGGFEHVAFVRP